MHSNSLKKKILALSSINGTILQMNTLKSNLNSPKKEDKDVDLKTFQILLAKIEKETRKEIAAINHLHVNGVVDPTTVIN